MRGLNLEASSITTFSVIRQALLGMGGGVQFVDEIVILSQPRIGQAGLALIFAAAILIRYVAVFV